MLWWDARRVGKWPYYLYTARRSILTIFHTYLYLLSCFQLERTGDICEVLQTKRDSIPLGMSLLVCGPAWAWIRDLQIMRTIRWYSTITNDFSFYWISNSYVACYSWWNSLNPPNWNSLFTHCLRRINIFPKTHLFFCWKRIQVRLSSENQLLYLV